jgi:hypothetical protein
MVTSRPPPPASTAVPTPGGDPVPTPQEIAIGEPYGVTSYEDLVEALEAHGVRLAGSDMLFPPTYFAEWDVSGRAIEVGVNQDAEVPAIVFEFIDISTRAEAQLLIDLELGVIGNESLADFDRLAFFGTGNLIVMYIGDDADTIDLLSSILGKSIDSISDDDVVDPSASILKVEKAYIESVELVTMESDPVQITVNIVAGLPSGCHSASGIVSHRAENIFGITVSNSIPTLNDMGCTDDYRTYEETVSIGSREAGAEFKNGVIYTLVVNDRVLEFTTNGVQNETATLSDYDALMLALAAQDVTPRSTEETVSGVFGTQAGIIKLGDADIQVHEFDTVPLAQGMASGVSTDGGTIKLIDGAEASISWIAPPHFFLLDNVIALYLGDDPTTLSALLGVAGESFAGSSISSTKPLPEPITDPTDDPVPFPIPTQRAPIESVEVQFLESFPVQHALLIVAGLENSCIEPYGSQAVTTAGADGKNVVSVEVTNVVGTPGTPCDELYRTYEENINLGSGFESGSEWEVFVNGELQISFTAQ